MARGSSFCCWYGLWWTQTCVPEAAQMRNFHHSPSFEAGFCSWNSEKRQILELELQKSADSGGGADFCREVGTPGGVSKRSQFVQIWC